MISRSQSGGISTGGGYNCRRCDSHSVSDLRKNSRSDHCGHRLVCCHSRRLSWESCRRHGGIRGPGFERGNFRASLANCRCSVTLEDSWQVLAFKIAPEQLILDSGVDDFGGKVAKALIRKE